jgi:hypothetical protein
MVHGREKSDEPRSTDEAPEQGREERRRRAWREGGSVGGKASGDACPGLSTGNGASQEPLACGSVASKPTITPDLRQEPGARKPHAGICAGGAQ